MITKVVDKHSGAIIFKKDKESLNLEMVMNEVVELRNSISQCRSEIDNLRKSNAKLEKRLKETK